MGTMQENTMARDKMNYRGERIAWIDIYKGLAICLVVIGHATGLFNSYIYQFHMAAFFFISGYVTQRGKRNTLKTLWDRFYTLILPYLTVFLLMLFLEGVFSRLGLYEYFFSKDFGYIGFGKSITQLFLYGNCYVWWLGAAWFVLELFAIELLHSVLAAVSGENKIIYLTLIGIVYCIGYYCIQQNYFMRIGFVNYDMAFIGLGFYGIGFLAHEADLPHKLTNTLSKKCFFCVLSISILYFFANIVPTMVDYPSRTFNHLIVDLVMGLNGCFLTFLAAREIEKIKYIRELFTCLGRNTLGIAFFHFQFFKVVFFLFYFFDMIPFAEVSNLVPAYTIGAKWWWVFASISIAASIAEWKLLTTIKGIRFFFGGERALWSNIYIKLKRKAINKGIVCPESICSLLGEQLRIFFKKPIVILGILVVLLACIPLWNQGIMCNDELQYYHWARQGFLMTYKHYRTVWIAQGRFLSSLLTPIWMYLSAIGENIWEYRIIPVCTILLNIALFGILLYRLFYNKYFAAFCCFVLVAFLPVTFAPMAPNAFSVTFGIPFSFLLGAMILYVKHIDRLTGKYNLLIAAMMLAAFSSYEIFVTYVPLFCMFALLKKGLKNKKELIKSCLLPIFTGVLYLLAYIFCRIIWPSSYDGNNIDFTISGAVKILIYLAKISFPGSFLCSPTYRYINEIYHSLQLIDYIRIAGFSAGLLFILYKLVLWGKSDTAKPDCRKKLVISGVSLMYIVLPALPLAISSMYQDNVGEGTGFIALPTTYFTYFSAAFLCCFIIWEIMRKKKYTLALTVIMVLISIPLQYMNSNFSIIQNRNFMRIKEIERFLTTNAVMSLTDTQIYSKDLFQTELSLGIHAGYWQDELARHGKNLQITPYTEETAMEQGSYFLSYVNDDYFLMEGSERIYIASVDPVTEQVVELLDGTLRKYLLDNPVLDNGYYIYTVNK